MSGPPNEGGVLFTFLQKRPGVASPPGSIEALSAYYRDHDKTPINVTAVPTSTWRALIW